MQMLSAQPSASRRRRLLDWLAHVERALEMRPVDRLELRVAELERRLDRLRVASPAREA